MDKSTPLERAADAMDSWAGLARALGLTPMAVLHWRKRGVPIERCGDIERVTGGAVKRHELRPDIFDPPHQQEVQA